MISQNCPVCHSSRIRRGYRPTRIWSKLLFRYNLLCDNCNWEFSGFAFPLFGSSKQTKSSRDRKENNKLVNQDDSPSPESGGSDSGGGGAGDSTVMGKGTVGEKQKIRRKIKIRV